MANNANVQAIDIARILRIGFPSMADSPLDPGDSKGARIPGNCCSGKSAES
jgi:hypothetical protein